jgi:hypothetical protein
MLEHDHKWALQNFGRVFATWQQFFRKHLVQLIQAIFKKKKKKKEKCQSHQISRSKILKLPLIFKPL